MRNVVAAGVEIRPFHVDIAEEALATCVGASRFSEELRAAFRSLR